jgi:hypothetical protein
MIWPLSETVQFIEPYLPAQLVSAKAFSNVQTIANLLPDAMSAHYFETRLAASGIQVDFSTCVMGGKGGREILANCILLETPEWRRIRAFFKYWAEPTSPLYDQVPLMWLEFDKVDETLPKAPLPCVNICLDPEYLEGRMHSQYSNHANTRNYQPFIETALELLLGEPVPPQTRQNLMNCFDLLPPGGQIIYVSAMLPRQPPTLKLNGFAPKSRFLEYLIQIGWTGSITEVEKILETFCAFTDKIRFDLTVGCTISSRVGFEFFSKGYSPSNSQRQLLLNQFVDRGLCKPEKRNALLAWPGFSGEKFSCQSWPTRLDRFWYTKIVYQPNHPLEAKGYLGFTPNFFSPFSLF